MLENHLPNSSESLRKIVAAGLIPSRRIWGMLVLRSLVSFSLLLLLAFLFQLSGTENPIVASSAWWLWFVMIAGVISIILMSHFGRKEGLRLRDIYNLNKSSWKGDLLWLLIGLAVTALVAQAPGTWMAEKLWGDPDYPNTLLIQPLPLVAIYPLFLLMPIIHGFAELPIYWGYVSPRLRAAGMNRWLVICIVGFVLSIQHMFFSFQLDWRYDLWLAIKFLPFALWTGFLIDRRPTVLPYLMAVHILMDAMLPVLVYLVSTGRPLGL
jgi:hypothetical protein